MRLVVAAMLHETNTFSPIPTDVARFGHRAMLKGKEARDYFKGTNTAIAAFIDQAEAMKAEMTIPITASAVPSGKVAAKAYKVITDAICEAIDKGCDAALLDLHGAMVTETEEDGEGALLARIRKLRPGLPIAVALDPHCNCTQAMVDNATALVGYSTYPHIDMYDTGKRAGRIVLDAMAGKTRPVMSWKQVPLLSQTLRQGTDDEPMKSLNALARAKEMQGLISASILFGFPLADIRDAGFSVVAIADGDKAKAEAAAEEIARAGWNAREDFVYKGRALAETVAEAKDLTDGPIVLLDHSDNAASGATQDVMTVIAEVMRQGLEDVAVAAVWDPQAVQEMTKAGVGATVTIGLGGKTDMPSINLRGKPLSVTGKVKTLTDGEFVIRGPMGTGTKAQLGPAAVLDTGKMQIVVISRHHEPFDVGIFTSLGIQPTEKRYLLLKSRIHYRAGFAKMAKHTFRLDGQGVTTSDNTLLDFKKIRRPIYPLDRINDWR
ncbi:MAG: M81 family metallopeptidase [Alphaproteobacteria bacterium]|nr:M81 family metallopeptidase [Alphaproteobacteria bacterium]